MALNFNWEMLLEPSLFTEDPWWLYILYGAGWTIGLAVSAFALALAVGIVIGTLRTVLQHGVHQHQRQHRFGDRHGTNTDTGIMTAVRFHHDRIAAAID